MCIDSERDLDVMEIIDAANFIFWHVKIFDAHVTVVAVHYNGETQLARTRTCPRRDHAHYKYAQILVPFTKSSRDCGKFRYICFLRGDIIYEVLPDSNSPSEKHSVVRNVSQQALRRRCSLAPDNTCIYTSMQGE